MHWQFAVCQVTLPGSACAAGRAATTADKRGTVSNFSCTFRRLACSVLYQGCLGLAAIETADTPPVPTVARDCPTVGGRGGSMGAGGGGGSGGGGGGGGGRYCVE